VTLEILSGSASLSGERSKLVRRYSSDDRAEPLNEKELTVPTYWVRPPRVLTSSKGMHRFVWDYRYPPPDAFQRDLPISAIYLDTPREPLGVLAPPGTYVVKLTVGGRSFTEPLTLKMDPRASIGVAGLSRQVVLARKIVAIMNRRFVAKRTVLK